MNVFTYKTIYASIKLENVSGFLQCVLQKDLTFQKDTKLGMGIYDLVQGALEIYRETC